METKDIDKMIKQDLNMNIPGMEIDIRRETMALIETYEKERAKARNIILWGLSIFTFFAGLVSIYIFEFAFGVYELFFLRISLNVTTVRLVFQGIFFLIVLISLTVMISQVKPIRRLNLV